MTHRGYNKKGSKCEKKKRSCNQCYCDQCFGVDVRALMVPCCEDSGTPCEFTSSPCADHKGICLNSDAYCENHNVPKCCRRVCEESSYCSETSDSCTSSESHHHHGKHSHVSTTSCDAHKTAKKNKKHRFVVKLAEKNGHHLEDYNKNGKVIVIVDDGVPVMRRYQTYIFDIQDGVQKFMLTDHPTGGPEAKPLKGSFMHMQGASKVVFSPGKDTPKTIYYQSGVHPYMGGVMMIKDNA